MPNSKFSHVLILAAIISAPQKEQDSPATQTLIMASLIHILLIMLIRGAYLIKDDNLRHSSDVVKRG